MSDQNSGDFELLVRARYLRFRIVRTAITLGLTFAHLAKTEGLIGNTAQAKQASEKAKDVYKEVQDYLRDTELNKEERQWVQERFKELEKAIKLMTM